MSHFYHFNHRILLKRQAQEKKPTMQREVH